MYAFPNNEKTRIPRETPEREKQRKLQEKQEKQRKATLLRRNSESALKPDKITKFTIPSMEHVKLFHRNENKKHLKPGKTKYEIQSKIENKTQHAPEKIKAAPAMPGITGNPEDYTPKESKHNRIQFENLVDITEKLHGYLQVQENEKKTLDVGDYVKYINHAGEFVDGCFILRIGWDDEKEQFFWQMAISMRGGIAWNVDPERVQKIWLRKTRNLQMEKIRMEQEQNTNLIRGMVSYFCKKYGASFEDHIAKFL